MSDASVWRLTDLTVGFGTRAVVSGIDLEFAAGEMIAIVGRNGSGKSCLVRTLAGDLVPLAGAVVAPAGFVPQAMGVVPQDTGLEPRVPITLGEIAVLGLAGMQVPDKGARLREALAVVGLTERAGQSWQRSSGGERQRALIARALVRRPYLLLLDEATSQLDRSAALQLFDELRQRCQAGLCVVAVLHDHELAQHADRVIEVVDGSVREGLQR